MENNRMEAFQDFFKKNIKIKEMMVDIDPKTESNQIRRNYEDVVVEDLKSFEFMFKAFSRSLGYGGDALIEMLAEKFKTIREAFYECESGDRDFKKFYQRYIADIDPHMVQFLNENVKGHYLDKPPIDKVLNKATSINALLHVYHHYVMNDDELQSGLPLLASRPVRNMQYLNLRGIAEPNSLARDIFTMLPFDIDSDEINIIGLDDKDSVIMMIRGVGHATTINISKEDGKYWTKYFIPKVHDRKELVKLQGINIPKDPDAEFATGVFASGDKKELFGHLDALIADISRDPRKDEYSL